MSNGICKITVKGTSYTLRFQRAAVQYVAESLGKDFVHSPFKSTLELFYAGMMNEAIFNNAPSPTWQEVYDIVENFHDEENASEQLQEVNKTFEEGRWGGDFMKKIEELKKKADQMMMESDLTGTTLEDTA